MTTTNSEICCAAQRRKAARQGQAEQDDRASQGGDHQGIYLDNCDLVSTTISDHSQLTRIAMYGGPLRDMFVVGGSMVGAGQSNVLSHHIHPQVQEGSLYKWTAFGSGPNRNYCVDTNYNSNNGSMQVAQYILISECFMTGTERCWDGGQSANLSILPRLTNWKNYVVEGNSVVNLRGDLVTCLDVCRSHTCRDNFVLGDSRSRH